MQKWFIHNMNDMDSEEIKYTRYLYIENEVRYSLMLSLMERNVDESLFWIYELYFSGYDVFDLLFNLYEILYITRKNILVEMSELRHEWIIDKTRHEIPGIFITNMINYKYSISKFVKKIYKLKCKDIKQTGMVYSNKFLDTNNDVYVKYETMMIPGKVHKTLGTVCKYYIRKELNTLCRQIVDYDPKIYTWNWLYYASFSPLWKERIEKYGGKVDVEKKEVIFESDDEKDKFEALYDLEPDEQSTETQEKSYGKGDEENREQYTVKDLVSKYGGILEHT